MSLIKAIIKYGLSLVIVAIIIAALFVVFRQSPEAITLLKFFIFPGAFFVLGGALFYDWFDRKMYARMQNRIGPRLIQPVYDLLKLLAKEDITPDGVDTPEFDLIPAIQLGLALLISFTVPIYIYQGLISFEGDVIFILALLVLIGGSIFLLGWTTNNPYGLIGGSRAAVAEFSFGIPLALSMIGPAILAGSLQISRIAASGYTLVDLPLQVIRGTVPIEHLIFLLPLIGLFGLAILSVTALLEKVPFDPAHAEVEIIGGWNIEISGKKLLFSRLANLVLEFSLAGIIAAVFLGSPGAYTFDLWVIGDWDVLGYIVNVISFGIRTTIVVFFITLMRTLHSRIRIDQLVRYFWRIFLPFGLTALFVIIILVGVI
ncbi:MAG: complex I subunit 1 family protein [Promethearchaeota archaeon]